MEVLPVQQQLYNQHPSCLHPLSRAVGIGFIWILDNCYYFTHGRSTHILACVAQRQPETDPPPPPLHKRPHI